MDQDETADGIIAAANHAMRRHPGLDRIRDIKTSHSSREDVVAWLQEDIPVDLIVETIQRSVGSFRPAGRDRQINSMRYFDDAIREAWQARRAKPLLGSEAASIRNEKPGGDRRGSADLARLNAEAEARTRQTEDIQAWVTEHPAEWSRVKTSIEEELKRDDFWKGMPDLLITKTVEARCREAIAQRMAKEANAA